MDNTNRARQAARDLSAALNCFGNEDVIAAFVDEVLRDHRTLQQSTFKTVLALISAWGNLPETAYDGRNEFTVMTCKKILKLLQEDYTIIDGRPCVPFI